LRICEAYEHEPILSYQGEDCCSANGCNKTGTQLFDIATAMTLTPTAEVGAATVTCQGTPTVTCISDTDGANCILTLTQQVCVSIPVRYGVTLTNGETTIGCADGCGCG